MCISVESSPVVQKIKQRHLSQPDNIPALSGDPKTDVFSLCCGIRLGEKLSSGCQCKNMSPVAASPRIWYKHPQHTLPQGAMIWALRSSRAQLLPTKVYLKKKADPDCT